MNSKSINKTISFLLIIFVFGVLPTFSAKAEDTYTLLAPLPCIATPDTTGVDAQGNEITVPGQKCTTSDPIKNMNLKDYLQYAVNLFIALASVAAVFMIVRGGFLYMTSTIPGMKNDGLAMVKNAIIGLLMVLCSYIILRTIDPRLVNLPSTIVPPLELSSKLTDKTDDFFDSLISDAQKYDAYAKQFVEDARAAKVASAGLEAQKVDLQEQLKTAMQNSDETAITNIQNQISNIDNEIAEKKNLIDIDLAKSIMDGGVSATSQKINILAMDQKLTLDEVDKIVASSLDFISETARERNASLASRGAYDQIQKIDAKVVESEVAVQLIGVEAKASASWTAWFGLIGNLDKAKLNSELDKIAPQIGDIRDPVVKKAMQDKFTAIKTKISKLK
ncbi:MAG: pilin [Candidatus Paceibacterota bacterium]|jgi:hypothetical protein